MGKTDMSFVSLRRINGSRTEIAAPTDWFERDNLTYWPLLVYKGDVYVGEGILKSNHFNYVESISYNLDSESHRIVNLESELHTIVPIKHSIAGLKVDNTIQLMEELGIDKVDDLAVQLLWGIAIEWLKYYAVKENQS